MSGYDDPNAPRQEQPEPRTGDGNGRNNRPPEQADNAPKGRRPDYDALLVRQYARGKDDFHNIGPGWSNRDGKGVSFDTVFGRIVIRERDERMKEYDQQRADQASQPGQNRQNWSRDYGNER